MVGILPVALLLQALCVRLRLQPLHLHWLLCSAPFRIVGVAATATATTAAINRTVGRGGDAIVQAVVFIGALTTMIVVHWHTGARTYPVHSHGGVRIRQC